jgi:CRP-like cAMP-binding protein
VAQSHPNPWAARLKQLSDLPEEDERLLDLFISEPRTYDRHQDIIRMGETPREVFVLIEGCACSYKILPDGRRQIVAFILPGDMFGVEGFAFKTTHHSIGTLLPSRIAAIPRDQLLEAFGERPQLARALWWSTLADAAILREWVVNVGQRSAAERTAHLFLELHLRMRAAGMLENDTLRMPMTHAELADTLGISIAQTNRSLQQLQRDGLIEIVQRNRIEIRDAEALRRLALFDAGYLHGLEQKLPRVRQE